MKEILEELNREDGINGSMIITPDGIMVSAALGPDQEEDRVAAIVSSLLVAVRRCLTELKAPRALTSCSLNARQGKILFFDMGRCFLVVMAEAEVKLDSEVKSIQGAIAKFKSRVA